MKKIISLLIGIIFFPTLIYSKILVIDPGHDYEDVVKGNKTETEVNTNWEVANKLKALIESDPNLDWQVFLTRSENINDGQTKDPYERASYATSTKSADPNQEVYFLSIHCNARPTTVTERRYGTLTLYCNNTFNTNDQLLTRYAHNIQKNIVEIGGMHDTKNCMEDFTFYKTYHLAVLKSLTMPNCLSEIGFVDDSEDAIKLLDDNYRDRFAKAYLEALKATFSDIEL
jgi:N-acetylmuramoyl-L-alanine amidase